MGQFFVWKIFVGICSLFFLPMSFFHGEKVLTPPPVSQPTSEIVAATTTPSREQTSRSVNAQPKPQPQTVKVNVPQTPVSIATSPSPSSPTVSAPGPLIVVSTTTLTGTTPVALNEQTLDDNAIIAFTNVERVKVGLRTLASNATLSAEAEVKARDMIAKQYFAHVAPDGVDIAALAEKYGYAYLNIGENLALGDFHSSLDVVSGWMNSPGHRANILNKEFTEIGVAAVEGNWKGERVWFAVQEFGRPTSDCPSPDPTQKEEIATSQSVLASLDLTLKSLQADIDAAAGGGATLSQKTNDYNTIVDSYNSLIASTKIAIDKYNAEVATFNACAGF